MAASNSTEPRSATGLPAFSQTLLTMPELEKISCSIKGKAFIHPLELMGKKIRFAEVMSTDADLTEEASLESCISIGTVLAVNLGSIAYGIETTLLIREDGFNPYYSDIADVTILEVLPDPAPAN